MKPFYLTGFMGVGKTTVAIELGKKVHVPVFDIDQLIEQAEDSSIRDLFREFGEDYFRSLETNKLKSISEPSVISTGGGIITKEENRRWMHQNGVVIFLDCDPVVIWERVQHDSNRPLASGRKKEELIALYKERLPFYLDCHLRLDTTLLDVDQVVTQLSKEWTKKNLGIL